MFLHLVFKSNFDATDLLDANRVRAARFELRSLRVDFDQPRKFALLSGRSQLGHMISIQFRDSKRGPIRKIESNSGFLSHRKLPPSEVPLGVDVRYHAEPQLIHIFVGTDEGRFDAVFTSPYKLEGGYVGKTDYDWKVKGEDVFFERYTRTVVARVTGSFMSNTANITSGGISVPGLRSRDGKRTLGNLHDWTKKKGWSWTEDPRGFTTLRKGTDWAVVPLGGNKIKINGEWQDLPDLVSEKDGDWYLSASGLTLLNGA
jgi:hypothetical protein